MKYVYSKVGRTVCFAAILLISSITGTPSAIAQTPAKDPSADFVDVDPGKVIPNEYIDFRQKTRFAYEGSNSMTELPKPVEMRDLIITSSSTDGIVLQWRSTWEPDNLKLYEIEFSSDGINFQRVGVLPAGNYLSGKVYSFRHYPVNVRDLLYYRIQITDENGRFDYTPILKLAATGSTQNYVFPTIVNAGMVSVYLNDSFKLAQIVNSQGTILQTQLLSGKTGRIDISLNSQAEGICYVRLMGQDPQRNFVQKVFIR
jgi:hypothetical protein